MANSLSQWAHAAATAVKGPFRFDDAHRGAKHGLASVRRAKAAATLLAAFHRRPDIAFGGTVILFMVVIAAAAPVLARTSPIAINTDLLFRPPSVEAWFGGDMLGRSLWSRVLYGGRVSLFIGIVVAVLATSIGLGIGLIVGYFRLLDAVVMRVMDGLMAIPSILFAVALMVVNGSSMRNVIVAITIPEIPRVTRLVRAMVLSIRERPFVEAAVASGARAPRIIVRHIMPGTFAPLAVQATYVCASAIITEAYLSFLGAGAPPEIPSWGNIMAEGRSAFLIAPWIVLIPAAFVGITVLAINVLGDGLRDMLDPRIARRL